MFKHKRVIMGVGYVDVYTIIEIKWLFSIYFHVFNTKYQDRFHTHAFNAISFMIKGSYWEDVCDERFAGGGYIQRVSQWFRYIPREHNHRLLESEPNTMTILFTGPWSEKWTETKEGVVKILGWGRSTIDG